MLSDGADAGNIFNDDDYNMTASEVHSELNDNNYCDTIRSTLDKEVDGVSFQSKIAVIGVGFDATKDSNLKTCAGKDNVVDARDEDHLYDLIISLIAEEIGHLHTL
ncbi:hypothetical protein [Endozoicomonas sp.]|uniref:hypothetical protein n=1 Tax=Endozoicomonas sp. TaxID=1892382 RepID=UPI003839FAE3